MKICPAGAEIFITGGRTDGRTDGQTDMSKLIFAFFYSVSAPKIIKFKH